MNAERLHRILIDFREDLNSSQLIDSLNSIRTYLQNQINRPTEPSYQQNLVSSLQTFYENLIKSNYNNYSPTWKQIIDETSDNLKFGTDLKEQVEKIFSSNQITPAAALNDITTISDKSQSFKSHIDNLITAFEGLKIGAEELSSGECELGYTIPRIFVKNKLHSLNKEIGELSFILNSLTEAITGEKEDYEVKTISSSDFLLYVGISIYVAKVLSEVVEKIIDNYKKILEIKKLRNELKAAGVPDKQAKGIEDYANEVMAKEIETLVQETIKNYTKKDVARRNEITNALRIAFNKIANRIDNGFNIEIRVKELPVVEEADKTEDLKKQEDFIKSILQNAKTMEFIRTTGQPILQLKENDDEAKK